MKLLGDEYMARRNGSALACSLLLLCSWPSHADDRGYFGLLRARDLTPFGFLRDMLNTSRYGTGSNDCGFIEGDVGFGRAVAAGVPLPQFGPGGCLGVGPNGRPIVGVDQQGNVIEAIDTGFPFWAVSVIALYIAGLGAVLFAATRLRTPARSER